ncbi:polyubiquitin-like [Carassius carassius]|uniref:polyubiquitin-like n=1 Tax=Carassius carassius TaxID=217509 RepID=UPI002868880F|nr:polyubiquitin-like [Carassius carassius]
MNSSVMELKIKVMGGDERSLEVRSDATVGDLKQLISELFREPPHKLRLSAENGSLFSLDSRKLSEYSLHSGSVVILLIKRSFQVFVQNEKGKIGTYDVDVNETVDQLQTKVYNKERVPEDQQRLIYQGKQLEAGKKLQDYNIKSGDTIYMTLRLRGG